MVAVLTLLSFVGLGVGAASASSESINIIRTSDVGDTDPKWPNWSKKRYYGTENDQIGDPIHDSVKRFERHSDMNQIDLPITNLRYDGKTVAWELEPWYQENRDVSLCKRGGYDEFYTWQVFYHVVAEGYDGGTGMYDFALGRNTNHVVVTEDIKRILDMRNSDFDLILRVNCQGPEGSLVSEFHGLELPYINSVENTNLVVRPDKEPSPEPSEPVPPVEGDGDNGEVLEPSPEPSEPVPPVEGDGDNGEVLEPSPEPSEPSPSAPPVGGVEPGDDVPASDCVFYKPSTWGISCLSSFMGDLFVPSLPINEMLGPIKEQMSGLFPFNLFKTVGGIFDTAKIEKQNLDLKLTLPTFCPFEESSCVGGYVWEIYSEKSWSAEYLAGVRPWLSSAFLFLVYLTVVQHWYRRRSEKALSE